MRSTLSKRRRPSKPASAAPRTAAQWLALVAPYLWLVAFFLVPFLIVFKISLSQTAIAQPPYVPVLDLAAGWQGVRDFFAGLSLANYVTLAGDDLYVFSYLKSLKVAAVSTVDPGARRLSHRLCDDAGAIARVRALLVTLVVLPFWTSFLIRVYAWINILQRDGLLNRVLIAARYRRTNR